MNGSVIRGALNAVAAGAVFAGILLGTAGDAAWWQAWAWLTIATASIAALNVLVFNVQPELVRERATAASSAVAWDRPLVAAMNAALPLMLVVSGLDHRLGWTPPWGTLPALAALVVVAAGNVITVMAMRANRFFSSHVRIQHDRGHVPVDTGPYARVRHPGYAGSLLFNIGTAALLGSGAALLVAGVFVIVVMVRTAREDALLQRELPGYAAYAARVRWRLVPGAW